jgi:D-3-phosphoglycerate dehydrogenase
MLVLVFDPFLDESNLPAGVERVEHLGELLREADAVSLHCPLTDQTRGMIGQAELAAMQPTACLINTARGEVVDEAALAEALRDGRIAGAGLDSFADEPPATDNPLWALPNVIVTPHIAGVTSESFRRMGVMAVNNILSVLDGGDVDVSCVVNPEVLG